jgi:hypothetical protein
MWQRYLTKSLRRYLRYCRRKTDKTAATVLSQNGALRRLIEASKTISDSYGLTDFEYVRLYQMVTELKPDYVLECGTGKSTFIIAHAMSCNGNGKKLVTMEESADWAHEQEKAISYFYSHRHASEWFPGSSPELIELATSETAIERHRVWAGSCYKAIAPYPYSFMMIDGPELTDECFVNIDVVNVLKSSDIPISIWIDGRWPTVAMCRALFGDKLVTKPGWTHTEIYHATREDLSRSMKNIRKDMHKMITGMKYV